jgi:hypothetical protein
MVVAAAAEELAVMDSVNGTLGVSEMVDGAIVTPAGRCDTATEAGPAVEGAVSNRDRLWLDPPAVTVVLAGVTVSVGAAWPFPPLVAEPPQQSILLAMRTPATKKMSRRNTPRAKEAEKPEIPDRTMQTFSWITMLLLQDEHIHGATRHKSGNERILVDKEGACGGEPF